MLFAKIEDDQNEANKTRLLKIEMKFAVRRNGNIGNEHDAKFMLITLRNKIDQTHELRTARKDFERKRKDFI